MSPLVSIVITTYNRPDRLANALATSRTQSISDIEIIVVDGMNSEANQHVVQKANDKRIKYIGIEHDTGIQHARNVGCKAATGKFIAMLDDDDEWTPNKIELQLQEFKDNTIGLVSCYTKIGKRIDKLPPTPTYQNLLKSFVISPTSSLLIRREIMEEIGYWNESLRGMHEHDIALKTAQKGYKIQIIQEPLLIKQPLAGGLERSYYHKIAELFDLWHYYSKDFTHYLGIRGLFLNFIKTVSLIGIFSMGFLLGDRIWRIIYPMEAWYQRGSEQ